MSESDKAETPFHIQVPTMDDIMRDEVAHMKRLTESSWMRHHFALRAQWLSLMMKTVVAAEVFINEGYANDLFRVFTILGTRRVSHHQAVFSLLAPGKHGEAAALSRMLLEVTALITYLGHYPEDATAWREAFSRPPISGDEVFKKGRSRFAWGSIVSKLEKKGVTNFSRDMYSRLNAAIHASEYGAQFYG